jgi:glycosyltransferase involved in cell wall biosynthesis
VPDPAISVILPTRGRPELLPRAVASVFAQTEPDFELIVVDDNPPQARDLTRQALAPWSADPRLRVIGHEHPRNAAAARNAGLAEARGRWVTYLDDDDAYRPAKLAAQRALAERSGSPVVLCGLCYRLGLRLRIRQTDAEVFAGAALALDAQPTTQVVFHRRTDAVRFDEVLDAVEDQDFFLTLVAQDALTAVPNVALPLVDVYPQTRGPRANAVSWRRWRAQRCVCLRHGRRCDRQTRRRWVARIALLRHAIDPGWPAGLAHASWRLLAVGGRAELRLVLNTWLQRLPRLRRLVVS